MFDRLACAGLLIQFLNELMPNGTTDATTDKRPNRELDLEIKDAQLIFDHAWNALVREFGEEKLHFPREIFWLNGAPGSGKGTQTRFIMDYKGLTAAPVVVSDLLKSPEAVRLKDAGMMVGDREVTELMMRALMQPENRSGVVVDGFPRTKVQVECLKLFYQKLLDLRRKFRNSPYENNFPRPIFHIIVLYVDEQVSIHRQLHRGQKAQLALREGEYLPEGQPVQDEVRKTDLDPDAARNRYRTFKEITYPSLNSLREIFHYHFINAQDSIERVQERIVDELKYQSSLELDQETADLIAGLPIASSITVHARQELVRRLDDYSEYQRDLFAKVVQYIEQKFMPIVLRHAISGLTYINSEDELFEDASALAMVIDIFSERGYHAVVDIRKIEVPARIDLQTGEIETRRKKVYRFRIQFPGSQIRRGR